MEIEGALNLLYASGHKDGFQAGLKRGAEIVSDFAAYRTTSEGKPEWAHLIEQAILKEIEGDGTR